MTGWIYLHACVSFMLGVGVDLPAGAARGRVRVDHNTFDRMLEAGVRVGGSRDAWVPEDRTTLEVVRPVGVPPVLVAVPPVLITNNLFLGSALTYEGAFPPGIELDGDWPVGASPVGPSTAEPAAPLIVGRNAFVGYAAGTPPPNGAGDLPVGRGNPIEATGGPQPGGRFYTGTFRQLGTPLENLINVKAGVARRAEFVTGGAVAHDYHLAVAFGTTLLDESLPERLPSPSAQLRALVSQYWGYPAVDGVELQNRDHWGNARKRVQLLSPGGAALGASERPGYADFPIVMNNVNELSNILASQNASLPYYSFDPPVEDMADAASYYSNLAVGASGPLEQEVTQAFSLGTRLRPLADMLDEAGLLVFALFPWAGRKGGSTSPGPLLPGVPFAFPRFKQDIGPAFTEWYLPRAQEFLRLINEDPTLHRVVAGFEAVEETRANSGGFWRETYLQNRLASMFAMRDREHRGLFTYTANIDGSSSMPGALFPAQYLNYPLAGLDLGLPPGYTTFAVAQSLLGEFGAEDPIERRLLWDDRGFPVTDQQVQPDQQSVFDSQGRVSAVYDPERPDGSPGSPQGSPTTLGADPSMTSIATAGPYPAPALDSTNYRPWSASANFQLSFYPLNDRGGHLLIGSQPIPGNYVDHTLRGVDVDAPNGNLEPLRDFDRTRAIHLVERVASGIASAQTAANIHSQSLGMSRVFHAVHLTDDPERIPRSAAHARHDFWAGLHVADALYFHNHARRHTSGSSTPHPAWETYAECLVLLKSTVREFMAIGEPVDIGLEFVAATDMGYGVARVPEPNSFPPKEGYGILGARRGPRLGYIPGRPVLRASAYRLGHRILAFITNSFEQDTSFRFAATLPSGESITSASLVLGATGAAASSGWWAGSIFGIDGTVLELTIV